MITREGKVQSNSLVDGYVLPKAMSAAYLERQEMIARQLRVRLGEGLSAREARRRLMLGGNNEILEKKRWVAMEILFDRLRDPLVLFLMAAVLLSLLLRHTGDAVVIAAAIFVDFILSWVQIWQTQRTLARLNQHTQQTVRVLRGTVMKKVYARDLVIGDVIELTDGDRVPADARVIASSGLRVREAALTGEADDVLKQPQSLKSRTPLGNRTNMLYLGTTVMAGSGRAVVTATGTRTEFGKIAQMLKTQEAPPSPLRRKLRTSGLKIAGLIFISVAAMVLLDLWQGESLFNSLRTAVALIVSAIPEDLTIILTIALTVGVNRILRKGGLVRNMQAGEALGAATVICTDKTGTLTRGDMRAEAFYMPQGEQVTLNQPPRGPVQALALIGLALASDAHRARPDALKYLGSATERSALEFVEKFGFNQQKLREKWRRRDSITFSSVWKYRASLHDHPTNETRTLFVSGAPDVLLARSSQTINDRDEIVGISGKCRQELEAEIKKMAAAGTRILAVALRSNMRKDNITHRDVNNLTFAGVLTITDPIREEVRQAVWETKSAGIAVKLVTGDYEPTARGVAHQLGLGATDEEVLSGEILESLSDQELAEAVGAVNVFARVSPLDKKRIVRALQKQGEVVAMTGDGVNDAVALKTADIGVAMGSGKDVAKDAADLVLLDDNFATIVAAIKEGRVVRDNIRKVIAFLLSTNMAEVAIFIASFLARMPLPLLPAQILWINLVTDGTSDMALALEKQESDVMKRGPERPDAPLIDRELFLRIFWAGLALTAATMGIYWYLWHVMQADLAYVRTMTFTFLAVASLLSTWSYRSLKGSMFKKGLRHNWWLFVSAGFSISLQLAAIYVPALQKFFGTVPLYRNDWLVVLAVAVMTVILIESRKLIKVPDKRLPRLRLWPRMRPHRTSHNYD